MRGSYHVRVSNRTLSYEFTLKRNITILKGDSATGKTTLVEMIREYELQGEDSAIQLSCEKNCTVVEGNTWKRQLNELTEESIVFIDEGSRFVASEEFAAFAKKCGHYFVIVTREALYNLPYSVTEIYGIRSSGKYNSLRPVYHEFYRIYPLTPSMQETKYIREIITEDSNSGYQFFSKTCHKNISCISAGGNSNVLESVRQSTQGKNDNDEVILVVADGAAFGAFMAQLSIFMKKHKRIYLYLPESFEWLILSSGVIKDKKVSEILKRPGDYIESKKYFSWEQFFTELLIRETKNTYLQYQKTKLNPVYLQTYERNLIKEALPEPIENLVEASDT